MSKRLSEIEVQRYGICQRLIDLYDSSCDIHKIKIFLDVYLGNFMLK